MKKIILPLLSIFLFISAYSQQIYKYDLIDFYNYAGYLEQSKSNALKYDDIKGSPYLQDAFIPGRIYLTSGSYYDGVPLRYNVYDDHIEFQNKDGIAYYLDNPAEFSQITIGDDTFIHSMYIDENNHQMEGYFSLIEGGKGQLLMKYRILYREAEEARPFIDPKPARFISASDEYYIRVNDHKALCVKGDKPILDALADHSKEVKAYIKENKLKSRKKDDLIKIIKFYNTL